MLTTSMILMDVVGVDHHVGIREREEHVEALDETKHGRCHQPLLMSPVMAQTHLHVCLCVQCLLTQLCTRARMMH